MSRLPRISRIGLGPIRRFVSEPTAPLMILTASGVVGYLASLDWVLLFSTSGLGGYALSGSV